MLFAGVELNLVDAEKVDALIGTEVYLPECRVRGRCLRGSGVSDGVHDNPVHGLVCGIARSPDGAQSGRLPKSDVLRVAPGLNFNNTNAGCFPTFHTKTANSTHDGVGQVEVVNVAVVELEGELWSAVGIHDNQGVHVRRCKCHTRCNGDVG